MVQKQLMAVYGTLKRAHGNHRLIQDAAMPFYSAGVTKDSTFMLEGGGFPVARDGGNKRVAVELFEFESEAQIRSIDALEGHPEWYKRRLVPVEISEGEIVHAWMYIQPPYDSPQSLSTLRIEVTEQGVASWGT